MPINNCHASTPTCWAHSRKSRQHNTARQTAALDVCTNKIELPSHSLLGICGLVELCESIPAKATCMIGTQAIIALAKQAIQQRKAQVEEQERLIEK